MGPDPAGLQQLENLFESIISAAVYMGFIATLLLLVWSGFKYLTSGGEPKAIQSARDTMTWAFLGIFFMIIAWIVLQIIASFTGKPELTFFNLKSLCGDAKDPAKWFCGPKPSP